MQVISPRKRADHAIVVSLAKTGTNLVANLMRALGYHCVGQGLRETYQEIDEKLAGWSSRTPANKGGLWHSDDLVRLIHEFPPHTCLFLHRIDFSPSLLDWCLCYEPPLLFNYRDPRDALLSLMNYLLLRANDRFTELPWNYIHAQILSAISDPDQQLSYAIQHMDRHIVTFREHSWLLYHPNVCKISYERLVGANGGGDDQLQRSVVADVMGHVGMRGDPASLARGLYNPGARTFHQGKVQGWAGIFNEQHVRAFERKYADILATYGYPLHPVTALHAVASANLAHER